MVRHSDGSTRPVQQINQQLNRLHVQTLSKQVQAPDTDPEIRALVSHFKGLPGRLQTSFAQIQNHTSQVAHDLRTPLQLMRLRIESNATSRKPEPAEELQEELARLSAYVETALTIARTEQGRLELNPEPVALKEFLTNVLEPFSRLASSQVRRLLWSCPSGVVVQVDRNALKQILFNPLSNALKHGDRELMLRVRLRRDHSSLLLGNRTEQSRTHAPEGLGIGLRLVQALAGQMPEVRLAFRRQRVFWVRLHLPLDEAGEFGCEQRWLESASGR